MQSSGGLCSSRDKSEWAFAENSFCFIAHDSDDVRGRPDSDDGTGGLTHEDRAAGGHVVVLLAQILLAFGPLLRKRIVTNTRPNG